MNSYKLLPEKVLCFSMILCSVIAFILQQNNFYKMFKNKLLNKWGVQEIIHV